MKKLAEFIPVFFAFTLESFSPKNYVDCSIYFFGLLVRFFFFFFFDRFRI
jgi:hypothetical protein